jgi:hypothetical protein
MINLRHSFAVSKVVGESVKAVCDGCPGSHDVLPDMVLEEYKPHRERDSDIHEFGHRRRGVECSHGLQTIEQQNSPSISNYLGNNTRKRVMNLPVHNQPINAESPNNLSFSGQRLLSSNITQHLVHVRYDAQQLVKGAKREGIWDFGGDRPHLFIFFLKNRPFRVQEL